MTTKPTEPMTWEQAANAGHINCIMLKEVTYERSTDYRNDFCAVHINSSCR